MKKPTPATERKLVEKFNANNALGAPVVVRMDSGELRKTTTRSAAQLLGGHTAVVWLHGIPGAYSLRCIQPKARAMKLPMPSDAIMIVAARSGSEHRENVPGVKAFLAHCRHCAAELCASVRTRDAALSHPRRGGLPVKYFCEECARLYRLDESCEFYDHRPEHAR